MSVSDVLVIGAGVSGLAAAWAIRRRAPWMSVRILEASDTPGGWARTEGRDGYRIECGPQTLLLNQASTVELLKSIGLLDALVVAQPAARRRWLATESGLTPFPESPIQWLRWGALPWPARVRLVGEVLAGGAPDASVESVANWLERRLGPGAASLLADAGIAGVTGGLARHTDADVFHRARAWEKAHGSIVVGALRARMGWKRDHQEAPHAVRDGAMVSFLEGMGQLPAALAKAVGTENLVLNAPVTRVRQADGVWKVTTRRKSYQADQLVLALPPKVALSLLEGQITVPSTLRTLHHASLEAWTLGYPSSAGVRAPTGFGWLCTPKAVERFGMLGAMCLSEFFPGFGPEGWTTLRVMSGGLAASGHPRESMEAGEARVLRGLEALLGWSEVPAVVDRKLALDAIPQVLPGQAAALRALRSALWQQHNVAVAGWGWRGVGLHDALATGTEAGERVVERLSSARAIHPPSRTFRLTGAA